MLNVVIAGVGGQGSVLAAKILAQAAQSKGRPVRTAETIGMAQRGGSVTSHVRMGNQGEHIEAPLVPYGQADLVIALEPGEGVRALPYLAPDGLLVSATSAVPAVTANLAGKPYRADGMLDYLRDEVPHFEWIDEQRVCEKVGTKKVANVVMLAASIFAGRRSGQGLGTFFDIEDIVAAMRQCVKPRFVDMNIEAIEMAGTVFHEADCHTGCDSLQ